MKEKALIRFEGYELDPAARSLKRDGKPISVNPKTFDLLLYLAEHPQQVVTKEDLLAAVWPNSFVEERNLSQHVFLLRKALAATGGDDQIVVTLPGKGYQFAATVEQVTADAGAQTRDELALHATQTVARVVVEEEFHDEASSGRLAEPGRAGGRPALGTSRRRWWLMAGDGVAAGLLVGGAWFAWDRLHPRVRDHVQVAIADFENSTGDATFDRTLNKVVQIDLQQSPYFTVVGEGRLEARSHADGTQADAPITGRMFARLARG